MNGSPSTGSERNGAVAANAPLEPESTLATTSTSAASARDPFPTRPKSRRRSLVRLDVGLERVGDAIVQVRDRGVDNELDKLTLVEEALHALEGRVRQLGGLRELGRRGDDGLRLIGESRARVDVRDRV